MDPNSGYRGHSYGPCFPFCLAFLTFWFALTGWSFPQEEILTTGAARQVSLTREDRTLEGHGPCKAWGYEVRQKGILYLSLTADGFDPFLRLEDEKGRTIGEDDNAGGGTTAFIRREVEAGDRLRVTAAAARRGESGEGRLVLHVLPEPDGACTSGIDEARSLYEEALKARKTGDFNKARRKLTGAVSRLLDLPCDDKPEKAVGILWEAGVEACLQLQDNEQACRAFEQVALWRERYLPSTHPELLLARKNLSAIKGALGDYADAMRLAQKTYEGFARAFPEEHKEVQLARLNIGNLYFLTREYEKARDAFEQVYEVLSRTETEEDPYLLKAKQNLGVAKYFTGDLKGAGELLESLLKTLTRIRSRDDFELQGLKVNLASVKRALGDFRGANILQEEVYRSYQRTLPPEHPNLLKVMQNLALTRKDSGDIYGAKELEEKVYEIRLKTLPDDDQELQAIRRNLGSLRKELGDLRGAHALFEKVYEVHARTLPEDHIDRLAAMENLGVTSSALGDHQRAHELQEKTYEIKSRMLPDDHPKLQSIRKNLATTKMHLNDLRSAEELMDKVYSIQSRDLPEDHPDLAHTRQNLAMIKYGLGKLDECLDLEEKNYEILSRTLPRDHRELRNARMNLGVKIMAHKSRERGRALIREAADGERVRLSRISAMLSTRGSEEVFRDVDNLLDMLMSSGKIVVRDPEEDRKDLELLLGFRGLPDRRARLLDHITRAGASSGRLQDLLREIRAAREAYLRKIEEQNGEGDLDLEKIGEKLERAERTLAGEAGFSAESEGLLVSPSLADMVKHLPQDSAALVTVQYRMLDLKNPLHIVAGKGRKPAVTAFSLCRGGEVQRCDFEGVEEIDVLCGRFRSDLMKGHLPGDSGLRSGKALWETLKPVLEALPKGIHALCICPDQALASIPWEAIPLDDGTLLCDRFRITYLENLTNLIPRPALESEPSLLVCGGIDYGGGNGEAGGIREGSWMYLPGTKREAETVRTLFSRFHPGGDSSLLTGNEASRASFVERASQYRILHLATHGYAAPDAQWQAGAGMFRANIDSADSTTQVDYFRGRLTGIVFAGANLPVPESQARPVLTAFELSGLDLSNCELAVLSACETNVGTRYLGESVAGLNRALHLAGARGSITSLWKVHDQAARLFFTKFYSLLWENKVAPADALHVSKRWLRNLSLAQTERLLEEPVDDPIRGISAKGREKPDDSASRPFAAPRYWAPFVYWGR